MRGEQKIVMYSCILSLQSQVHFDLLTNFGSSKKVSVFAFLFAETFLTWQIFGIVPYIRRDPLNVVLFQCNSLKIKPFAGGLSFG